MHPSTCSALYSHDLEPIIELLFLLGSSFIALSLSLLQANGEAVQFLSRRSRTPRHDTKGLGGGNRGNRGNSGIQSRHRMTYRE